MTFNQHNIQAHAPVVPLLQAHRLEKRRRRELVAKAKTRAEEFITLLGTLPYREKAHTLSMDLISLFEKFCGFDLPEKFSIEFGRQISKACRAGKLPFERSTFGRASLAGFKGIDSDLVVIAMRKATKPAA